MIELTLCSLLTILPDFLFRRFVQGKRLGRDINLFSMWYELRWGITGCAILTISLITVIFYYHPATHTVASYFRTVTVLPETGGRVDKVYVTNNQEVKAGDLIFELDSSAQRASVNTARSRIDEIEAQMNVAQSELASAEGVVNQAKAAVELVEDDFRRKQELLSRGSNAVPVSEVERLENRLHIEQGNLAAAEANLRAVQDKIDILLPAEKENAVAQLEEALTQLDKTVVKAGIDGRIEQLSLREGDYVSAVLRPAAILVPKDAGRGRFQAGFSQISAEVIKPGMVGEIGCMTKPFTIVPMVVTGVQDVIPSGQVRPSDNLLDPQYNQRVGSLTVYMEPIYEGMAEGIPPGSTCMANIYTYNHERLENEDLGTVHRIALHVVDTVGVVHAAGLRLRILLLPVTTLVFSGGH